jgi:hypothetical protein
MTSIETRPTMLWIDQYNNKYWAKTKEELREKVGGGRVAKMYVDLKTGESVHVGYVIGEQWLTGYVPMRETS